MQIPVFTIGKAEMAKEQKIETPGALSSRFHRELRELVEEGEISPSFAERVMGDLFEPAQPGEKPSLRSWVWFAFVNEQLSSNE
jgi:polyhydroxyalkanoate synthesis regulator phasin